MYGICAYIWGIKMVNVIYIYILYMDPMGYGLGDMIHSCWCSWQGAFVEIGYCPNHCKKKLWICSGDPVSSVPVLHGAGIASALGRDSWQVHVYACAWSTIFGPAWMNSTQRRNFKSYFGPQREHFEMVQFPLVQGPVKPNGQTLYLRSLGLSLELTYSKHCQPWGSLKCSDGSSASSSASHGLNWPVGSIPKKMLKGSLS